MKRLSILLTPLFLAQFLFAGDLVTVKRVIDGDTFETDSGQKVRLIGVDTPETVHPSLPVEYFGKEASAFTHRELEGKIVRLEYDFQKTDKYGRILAYVYLDTVFFNARLIREGYAHAYTQFPFKYLDEFRQLERTAREQGKGLWAKKSAIESTTDVASETSQPGNTPAAQEQDVEVYRTTSGQKYHRDGCRFLSKSQIPIKLSAAISMGLGACSVCSPPTLENKPSKNASQGASPNPAVSKEADSTATVYITKSGQKYHKAGCRSLSKSSIPISLSDAKARGYQPCSICFRSTITSSNSSSGDRTIFTGPRGGKYYISPSGKKVYVKKKSSSSSSKKRRR